MRFRVDRLKVKSRNGGMSGGSKTYERVYTTYARCLRVLGTYRVSRYGTGG